MGGRFMINGGSVLKYFLAFAVTQFCYTPAFAQAPGAVRLEGHMPTGGLSRATHLGRLQQGNQLSLTVALNLRDQAGLTLLIKRLHDPKDVLFGHFLTPSEFATQFGATPQDINTVEQYLTGHGLTVLGNTTNTIQVQGGVTQVEAAFNIEMHQYQTQDNRTVFAPNSNPEVSGEMAGKISGILGLNSFTNFVAYRHVRSESSSTPHIGTGPGGGLSPSDIQKAYSPPPGPVPI